MLWCFTSNLRFNITCIEYLNIQRHDHVKTTAKTSLCLRYLRYLPVLERRPPPLPKKKGKLQGLYSFYIRNAKYIQIYFCVTLPIKNVIAFVYSYINAFLIYNYKINVRMHFRKKMFAYLKKNDKNNASV